MRYTYIKCTLNDDNNAMCDNVHNHLVQSALFSF